MKIELSKAFLHNIINLFLVSQMFSKERFIHL